jgi:N utilization substance protein A
MFGRAIVLVREDQLSLAIGRRGQNVRLASKLCVWDIEIMTREELDEQIEQAVLGFAELDGVDEELAEKLVGEGFLSYDDLSVIEPDVLSEMGGGLTQEQVDHIVEQAEARALEAEKVAAEQRRLQREQQRLEAAGVQSDEPETAEAEAENDEAENDEAEIAESAEDEDKIPDVVDSQEEGASVDEEDTPAETMAEETSDTKNLADKAPHPE